MDNVFAFNNGDERIKVSISDKKLKERIFLLQKIYREIEFISNPDDEKLVFEMPVSYLHLIRPEDEQSRRRYHRRYAGSVRLPAK